MMRMVKCTNNCCFRVPVLIWQLFPNTWITGYLDVCFSSNMFISVVINFTKKCQETNVVYSNIRIYSYIQIFEY